MRVTVAKSAGFCFGVKRAVDTVYKLLSAPQKGKICILGHLIHNPHILKDIDAKGAITVSENEIQALAEKATETEPVTVVIRAHGITKKVYDNLVFLSANNPGFHIEDCTCPFVKKIHRIAAEECQKDDLFLVFGNPLHPEVVGICSYAPCQTKVLTSAEDIKLCKLHNKNVILVSQTTQKLSEWQNCQKSIKKYCTNAKIFDTICSVTENRQTEAKTLAATVDMMIVLGGEESSNTRQLYHTSKEVCPFTVMAEDVSGIPPIPDNIFKMGITAGASTPDSIIQEVIKTMSEIYEGENFAQLLEDSFKTLNTGDIVKGVITSVAPNELKVDLSAKVTGIVPFDEVAEDSSTDLTAIYKVGDTIEAKAIRVSDVDGVATLSVKQIARITNFKKIVAASETGEILEGKVTDIVKGGVVVTCMFTRVFIPAGQSGVPRDGDMEALRGKTVRFKIIDVNTERNRAVGSIRVVEREERKARLEEFWSTIEEGKQYTGTVKSLTSYGAFVDLGGIDGMVHASELSWTHIKNPAEVVSVGETLNVFVKSFDREKKRISLGYKTEETNPWTIFTNAYAVDSVAKVKIVSLMPFGAFAQIVPGVDGLIHISQIADRKIAKPADVLEVGQEVDAKIIAIDEENHKVSLSIRALLETAEETTEETAE